MKMKMKMKMTMTMTTTMTMNMKTKTKMETRSVMDETYLIATSEKLISAFHMKEWLSPNEPPKQYAGRSPCFRREAGVNCKEARGIFRVH